LELFPLVVIAYGCRFVQPSLDAFALHAAQKPMGGSREQLDNAPVLPYRYHNAKLTATEA